MRHAAWNEIFLSGLHRNPLPIDDQGITALHYEHIFVESVGVLCGYRSFSAGPKRHLASVFAVENITLNAWGRLTGANDPVCRMLHEFREIVHNCKLLSHWIRRKNHSKRKKGTA